MAGPAGMVGGRGEGGGWWRTPPGAAPRCGSPTASGRRRRPGRGARTSSAKGGASRPTGQVGGAQHHPGHGELRQFTAGDGGFGGRVGQPIDAERAELGQHRRLPLVEWFAGPARHHDDSVVVARHPPARRVHGQSPTAGGRRAFVGRTGSPRAVGHPPRSPGGAAAAPGQRGPGGGHHGHQRHRLGQRRLTVAGPRPPSGQRTSCRSRPGSGPSRARPARVGGAPVGDGECAARTPSSAVVRRCSAATDATVSVTFRRWGRARLLPAPTSAGNWRGRHRRQASRARRIRVRSRIRRRIACPRPVPAPVAVTAPPSSLVGPGARAGVSAAIVRPAAGGCTRHARRRSERPVRTAGPHRTRSRAGPGGPPGGRRGRWRGSGTADPRPARRVVGAAGSRHGWGVDGRCAVRSTTPVAVAGQPPRPVHLGHHVGQGFAGAAGGAAPGSARRCATAPTSVVSNRRRRRAPAAAAGQPGCGRPRQQPAHRVRPTPSWGGTFSRNGDGKAVTGASVTSSTRGSAR